MYWHFRYRAAFFLLIVALSVFGRFFPALSVYPVIASPFVALVTGIRKLVDVEPICRTVISIETIVIILVTLSLMTACLLRRRPLCHTICPAGFCFDAVGKIKKRCVGTNRPPRWMQRFPRLGIVPILLTVLAALFGGIGFLWLDPFVLFGSLFRQDVVFSIIFSVDRPLWGLYSLFLGLLAVAFFLPTFWCRRLCPLGETQDIFYRPALRLKQHFEASPTNRNEATNTRRTNPTRRLLLFGGFLLGAGILFERLRHFSTASSHGKIIRPPGALPEPFFTALCSRCGNCVQACPTKLLQPVASGLGFATPQADFTPLDPTWCEESCRTCSQVCPTGAIESFAVADKKNRPFALAEFDFESCRLYDDVECGICGRDCPYEAISYAWSEEDYLRFVVIDKEKCTGCGWCVAICPVIRESETPRTKSPLRIVPR